MGKRTYDVYTCDRIPCAKEFEIKDSSWQGVTTIQDLDWMELRNGSGSKRSDMPGKILCPDCTADFLFFMTGERDDD